MNKVSNVTAGLLGMMSLMAVSAQAQDQAAALQGPLVAGICLLDREAVVTNASAGKSASEQLQRLTTEAQTALNQQQTQLDGELQQLGLREPGLQESQLNDAQRAALQKVQGLQEQLQERRQQIDQARGRALQRISEEAQPLIAQVYAARKCGLLLDRTVVLGGNMGNDLTAEVVKALDQKLPSVEVKLEALAR